MHWQAAYEVHLAGWDKHIYTIETDSNLQKKKIIALKCIEGKVYENFGKFIR